MPHHVFFSYARDDQDVYLDRFFTELREEVRSLAGIVKERIGDAVFRDTSEIKHGADWERVLGGALSESQTFVAVCSKTYYGREFCGKEWQYFANRVGAHEAAHPAAAPRMFPVVWNQLPGKSRAPDVVQKRQLTHGEYGADYLKFGLRSLIKRDDPQARLIIERLAKSIVDVAQDEPWPGRAPKVSFDLLNNPFGGESGTVVARDGNPRGPRCAQFVYVAALRDEFREASISRPDEAYGDEPDSEYEWKPFFPPADTKAHRLVSHVASECDLLPERLPISNDLDDQIRDAEKKNKIVILLVDPWTLKLDRYRQILQKYDERRFYNAVLIVPWNESDPMTAAQSDQLRSLLEETFSRQEILPDRADLNSEAKLTAHLKTALQQCRARIVKKLRVMQRPMGPGAASLPLVTGPSGN